MNKENVRIKDVAEFLDVPINSVYTMVHRKQIPHLRLGPRTVRFSRAALEQWLKDRQVEAK